MNYKKFKEELLKEDAILKKEYEKRDLAFEISKIIIEARIFKGLTQAKLARLMKTKQPSIARVENGNFLPSISFLEKMALAMGARLEIPTFNFNHNDVSTTITRVQENTTEGNYLSDIIQSYCMLAIEKKSNPIQKHIAYF